MVKPSPKALAISLTGLGSGLPGAPLDSTIGMYEFHVSRAARNVYGLEGAPFSSSGCVVFTDYGETRAFADRINAKRSQTDPAGHIKAGALNAMALIDEVLHAVCAMYREKVAPDAFLLALGKVNETVGAPESRATLLRFTEDFPPSAVYSKGEKPDSWLDGASDGNNKAPVSLEELLLLRLENENPAFSPYRFLFDDRPLKTVAPVDPVLDTAEETLRNLGPAGPDGEDLLTLLRAPMRASPHSLSGQLAYMRRHWGLIIGDRMTRLLGSVDMLDEEERPVFPPGPGPAQALSYAGLDVEYERFSEDRDWMPRVVMVAKSALVWLDQLSKAYGREIRTLDAIPDEELDIIASRGFNALWLIGIWERSHASRRIKELCGNPEAAASAYSLFDYEIAWELGGWSALESLRHRAGSRGIRLAADMVPNHTGLDSAWIRDRPDLFIRRSTPPFPSYSYTGENLSGDGRIGLWLEDHYYDRRDAAVTFKRVDFSSGETSYIFHGNDGTSMPWNDTAQIDFLNPAAREAVKERILHVARNFPIIRFDAAMVLAKRSFRRLWYPEPGSGGAIASRFESALTTQAFNDAIPEEFWREVVDTCAVQTPETLLLAEAFWMMEGYFVRTLGMHRVYNSAFMNMLKEKKNAEYRLTIKNTIEFDKDILKRFVNFMNNPDEETAVIQFGSGDHYFGVCSMMATMPGLPMFGHGQVEGFTEKYGMEYRRAYKDEVPDTGFIRRHEHEIFPLLKRRYLFSGVDEFLLYDLFRADGGVDENVFAYSNGHHDERALVLFNNAWEQTTGTIHRSCPFADKKPDGSKPLTTKKLAEGLGLQGGKGRFTVLTEAKSGLRFIRKSDDLARHGLAVALSGFQCQVFINIREIDDDAKGSYAMLCNALGGAGVADLGWALQDMTYAELHKAWTTAVLAGTELDREAFIWLLAVMERFTGTGTLAATAAEKKPKVAKTTGASLEARAVTCMEAVRSVYGMLTAVDPALKKTAKTSSLGKLASRIQSTPMAGAALRAFAALLPVYYTLQSGSKIKSDPPRAFALAGEWGLDRKLREALSAEGMDSELARQAVTFAMAALARINVEAKTEAAHAESIFRTFQADEEARNLLGVNRWEGIEWINAEKYQLASTLMAGLAVVIRGQSPASVLDTLNALDEAMLASGWCLDTLFAQPAGQKN